MWDGGVPKDPEELAATLPVERPNFIKLFGFDPTLTVTPPILTSNSTPNSPTREDLSGSWDHLSSSSQSAAATSPTPTISTDLTYTWIGQSTSYIQIDGIGILTDPVFAFRTVETNLAPPRLCPPPCRLADLVSIQIVLVSHDHFDHVHPDDVKFIGTPFSHARSSHERDQGADHSNARNRQFGTLDRPTRSRKIPHFLRRNQLRRINLVGHLLSHHSPPFQPNPLHHTPNHRRTSTTLVSKITIRYESIFVVFFCCQRKRGEFLSCWRHGLF